MLKTRIIPCLDVKDGRVVKGVNFVELKDAGIEGIIIGRALYDGSFTPQEALTTTRQTL